MTTQFDIITQASIQLDANAVSSFSDQTREVEVFQPIYEQLKKSELGGYEWNFNTFTEPLTLEAVTPVDGRWNYQHLEPSNMMRLVSVFDSEGIAMAYIHEQQRIFTNLEDPYAKFQRNLTESNYPPYFIDLLVARLIWAAAEPLSGDAGVVNRAKVDYKDIRKFAKSMDTKQNPARPFIRNQSRYLAAFYGGTRGPRRFRPFGS